MFTLVSVPESFLQQQVSSAAAGEDSVIEIWCEMGLSVALLLDAARHSVHSLGHRDANSLKTRYSRLLTIISRPFFPSRHSAARAMDAPLAALEKNVRKLATAHIQLPEVGGKLLVVTSDKNMRHAVWAKFLWSSQIDDGRQIFGRRGSAIRHLTKFIALMPVFHSI